VRRLLKLEKLSFTEEVKKMENRKEFETPWKQKAKEPLSFGMRKLFEAVRNIYLKINHSESTTHLLECRTAETLKDCEITVEQQKAEAMKFLLRRLTIQ
jgi:hypothetical protein